MPRCWRMPWKAVERFDLGIGTAAFAPERLREFEGITFFLPTDAMKSSRKMELK
jgi:hypothetical protein